MKKLTQHSIKSEPQYKLCTLSDHDLSMQGDKIKARFFNGKNAYFFCEINKDYKNEYSVAMKE